MTQTRVVSVRGLEPFDIYIGRTMGADPRLRNVGWGNPFKVETHGLAESLRLYEAWVRNKPELMKRLPELRGKVLGCWCAPPGGLTTHTGRLICHGQVLMRLLAELDADGGAGARVPVPRPGPRGPRQAVASVEVAS